MKKQKNVKRHAVTVMGRIVSLVLSLAVVLGTVLNNVEKVEAASSQVYYSIDYNTEVKNSMIDQGNSCNGSQIGCPVASVATIEAYLYGVTSSSEKTSVLKAVVSANKNSVSYGNWSSMGYCSTSYSLQTLYDQLAQGYPVIVHRAQSDGSNSHYSVVCGYTGSSSSLQESGFIVLEIGRNISNRIMTLTEWKNAHSNLKLDQIVYRKNGVSITSLSGVHMAINYPEIVHKNGSGHGVYGYITSSSKLTNVTVTVTNATTGSSVYSKSLNPNAKSYKIYNLDSSMTFAKWSSGSYYYTVTATNSSGTTKTLKQYFTIASSWPSVKPSESTGTTGSTTSSNSTSAASTLTANNVSAPSGKLATGSAFTIAGTVTSNYAISSVTATVKTTGGTTKFTYTATLGSNVKSYSLYNMDSKMSFSSLSAGSYVFTITAKDTKGTKTLVTKNFTVTSASITSSGVKYPTSITKGKDYAIKGTVKCSKKLKSVSVSIISASTGKVMSSGSASTSATSYDVNKLDSKLKFTSLAAGTYIYKLAVTDSAGVTKYVVTKSFTVK